MLSSSYIKESAKESGFDLVGITSPREFKENRKYFEEWIKGGYADPLDYMKKYMDVRFDPSMIFEGCRSVIVCALNYKNSYSTTQIERTTYPQIASYALARDYHKVIRRQLKDLLRRLQLTDETLQGRCCVDTAPLLEKQLAQDAGLGWIGRQSLLITPQFGSYVLLGVLLLNHDVDILDKPFEGVGCGTCRRCIDSCPNEAILNNRTLDTTRCISALTVECDTTDPELLHGWLFGCDQCQSCCPHNRRTPLFTNSAMEPIFDPISAQEWQAMTPQEFAKLLSSTPMKRGGLERLQRNCNQENTTKKFGLLDE